MDYKTVLDKVEKFIIEKGDYVFNNWHKMTYENLKDGGADVTTNFDQEIEKSFSNFIFENFPDHGFVGEEFNELKRNGEYTWYIDPIDGTKFFASSIPFWSVTVALLKEKTPVLGLIYNPISKQLYKAYEGGGAYLNDSQIHLNDVTELEKLQVCIDISKTNYELIDYTDEVLNLTGKLAYKFYRMRMLGNGALSLAWLSQGFFGAFVDMVRPEAKFVDVAGGHIIAKEAGAEVYKIDLGNNNSRYVVARPEVVDQIRKIIET